MRDARVVFSVRGGGMEPPLELDRIDVNGGLRWREKRGGDLAGVDLAGGGLRDDLG